MHEWVDIFELIGRGGGGAFICGLVGGAIGASNGKDSAERTENLKWGALIGIILGGLAGVFTLAL